MEVIKQLQYDDWSQKKNLRFIGELLCSNLVSWILSDEENRYKELLSLCICM